MLQFRVPSPDVTPKGEGEGVGPLMDKFEQVSHDHHQMLHRSDVQESGVGRYSA